MGKRDKLSDDAIRTFLEKHAEWERVGDRLARTFAFEHYGAGVAFAVHVGFAADKRDHHPDIHLGYGKVRVEWTTHDAGGITQLDTEMAEMTENAYRRAR